MGELGESERRRECNVFNSKVRNVRSELEVRTIEFYERLVLDTSEQIRRKPREVGVQSDNVDLSREHLESCLDPVISIDGREDGDDAERRKGL